MPISVSIAHAGSYSPLLRQPPRNGSGENGLPEAIEQRGNAIDTGFQDVDLNQQFVEFGSNSDLLGKRRDQILCFFHSFEMSCISFTFNLKVAQKEITKTGIHFRRRFEDLYAVCARDKWEVYPLNLTCVIAENYQWLVVSHHHVGVVQVARDERSSLIHYGEFTFR
ncbi:hypothetical protein AX284_10500 [Pseudomonas sp. HUK17]|nr:hypothetical protein AX284_10500 [Pseudomonas sp. HUK17]